MTTQYDVRDAKDRGETAWTVLCLAGIYELRDGNHVLRGKFNGPETLSMHLAFALEEVDRLRAVLREIADVEVPQPRGHGQGCSGCVATASHRAEEALRRRPQKTQEVNDGRRRQNLL